MGGYGTFRIGMKYPEVFGSLYSMSAGGVFESGEVTPDLIRAESLKTKEDVAKLPYTQKSPFARGAAWSANPSNPPFFLDLASKDSKVQARIAAKWPNPSSSLSCSTSGRTLCRSASKRSSPASPSCWCR